MYFAASVLPAVAYIFTRVDHDCFNCFNRLAPRRYSFFQFSEKERVSKCISERNTILDESFDQAHRLHLLDTRGSRSTLQPNMRSSMQPYKSTLVYPCKHGESDYCTACEVRGLADTGRISSNITDNITKQIIEDMAPQTLEERDKESLLSSRRSETLFGGQTETKDRYSLTY